MPSPMRSFLPSLFTLLPAVAAKSAGLNRLRSAGLGALATLALLGAQPARAELASVAKSLPGDAVAAVAVDLQPASWSFFLKQPAIIKALMSDDMKHMSEEFKADTGMDLKELIGQFGSHAIVAIYPPPQGKGDPNFEISLELKNVEPFTKAVEALKAHKPIKAAKLDTYKGHDLIVELRTDDTAETVANPEIQRSVVLLDGKNLILASNLAQVKQMLDKGIGQGLNGNREFKAAAEALGPQPVMFWGQMDALRQGLNGELQDLTSDLGPLTMLQRDLGVMNSLGMGLRLDENGMTVKNIVTLKQNGLTGSQQAFVTRLTSQQGPGIEPLLAMMPQRPLLSAATGTFKLNFEMKTLSGINAKREPEAAAMAKALSDMLQEVKRVSGLDLNQDLLERSDGRMGLSVFYSDRYPDYDQRPNLVMMMGVKDGPSFIGNLQQKFRLHLEALDGGKVDAMTPVVMLAPKPGETYKNIEIYSVLSPIELKKQLDELWPQLQPCVAVVNQVALFGSSPEALRFTIDQFDQTRPTLNTDPQFNQLRTRMNGKDEMNLFYSDLTGWYRLADNYLHGEKWFSSFKPLFASFKALAADGRVDKQAAVGHLIFAADLKQVDFAKLEKALAEMDAQESKQESKTE